MFDLGWQEFLLVAIITVIVVGPKDLPRVVRSVSQFVRKARSMAREFQTSLEEVAREAELDDVRREVQSISKDGIGKSIEKQIDPDGSMRESVEDARKSANAEEIEAEMKSLEGETRKVASGSPSSSAASSSSHSSSATALPVETAEDYAAKSVSAPKADAPEPVKPEPAAKTETAAGTTVPAAAEASRSATTASGQG
ncbi:MAG: Sec-independent protein translocase protein TatB [Thalassobaculum sp.]